MTFPKPPQDSLGSPRVQQDGADKIDAALGVPGGLCGGGGAAGLPVPAGPEGRATEAVWRSAGYSESSF